MNRRNLLLAVFAIAALAQLAVPLGMIGKREAALRSGQVLKFRTAPVDPNNPFQGRYVALRLDDASRVTVTNASTFEAGQRVYALIEEAADGFARISRIEADRPDGERYIKSRVHYAGGPDVMLKLPFDEFYMPEQLSPRAETAYQAHSRQGVQDAYITVRVLNGFAVIENLYIAGKPILEYLKENP